MPHSGTIGVSHAAAAAVCFTALPIAAVIATQPAAAATPQCHSNEWVNVDPATRSMPKVIWKSCFQAGRGKVYSIHAFGKCHPRNCDWGTARASRASLNAPFIARYHQGFVGRELSFRFNGNRMIMTMVSKYRDNRGRRVSQLTFRRGGQRASGGGITAVTSPARATVPLVNNRLKDIRLRDAAVLVNGAVHGTRIRLHNNGRRSGSTVVPVQESHIQFGAGIGGSRHDLVLPHVEQDGPARARRYYYFVNDLNSERLRVSAGSNSLELRVYFENGGSEIKGYCMRYRLIGSGRAGCARVVGGFDGGAPDIEWYAPSLTIKLVPVAHRGSISFRATDVTVGGDFRAGGVCRITGRLCDRITNYRTRIPREVQGGIIAAFNAPQVQDLIAASIQPQLARLGVAGNVRTAGLSGDKIRITW